MPYFCKSKHVSYPLGNVSTALREKRRKGRKMQGRVEGIIQILKYRIIQIILKQYLKILHAQHTCTHRARETKSKWEQERERGRARKREQERECETKRENIHDLLTIYMVQAMNALL